MKATERELIDIGSHDCRWPTGDNVKRMTYCGQRVRPGSSYCDEHAMKARGERT